MLICFTWQVDADVSDESVALIFRNRQSKKSAAWHCKWRHYLPSKRR